jgi:type 1 glutamine amidotransferase
MKKEIAEAANRGRKGLVLGLALTLACGTAFSQAKPKVLDFYGVGGFAHGSRNAANTYLDSLSKAWGFDLVQTEAATVMTAANLAQYAVVILNNSTESGKLFNTDQRAALLGYMDKHGFIGMHGSGDTKGSWPDYTTYLGGELSSHGGGIAKLDIDPSDYAKNHPILRGLPTTVSFDEEWYAYKTNPRLAANVKVLYTLDESSCPGCTKMGGDHPVIWVKEPPDGGRTFYYAMGHGDNIFKKNEFTRTVLARAITWASGCTVKNPKYDMTDCAATTAVSRRPMNAAADGAMVKGGMHSLTVDTPDLGAHRVELLSLTGKRIAERTGTGVQSYLFGGLDAGTVYSVVVHDKTGRHARLVPIQ